MDDSSRQGRSAFRLLTADFFRQLGCDLPPPGQDEDRHEAVAFEVDIEDVRLAVGHDPGARDAALFIQCTFGVLLPDEPCDEALRQLLALNLPLGRERQGAFFLDRETSEVGCCLRRDLARADARSVREDLFYLAAEARRWRAQRPGALGRDPRPVAQDPGNAGLILA